MSLGGNHAFSICTCAKARSHHLALAVALMASAVGVVIAGPAQGQVCAQEFGLVPGRAPAGIATGSDGNIWFTEAGADMIGRITPWGDIHEFDLKAPDGSRPHGSSPVGITRGPDGALWFTIEFWRDPTGVLSGRIGRITTSGDITSYPIDPGTPGQPHGIVTGPDGALWFTFFNRPALGRITTAGVATVHPLPLTELEAHSITVGPDGALWFTDFRGDRIGRYVPGSQPSLAVYGLEPGSDPHGIITGPDGVIWFAEQGRHRLGRMSLSGQLLEEISTRTIRGENSGPHELAVDQYGQVWFTEIEANRVSRIDPATRAITRFCVPTPNSRPGYIVAGPDGAMWFHERAGDKIGRVLPEPPTTH